MSSSDSANLGDYVSVGGFTKTYPIKDVKRILREAGRASKRERNLPNHVVVYYVLSMTMLMTAGYREVLRWLLEGLRHVRGFRGSVKLLCTSGITQARQRLGYEPFELLYQEFVRPLATPATKGAWYKNWRLVSLDGSTVDVADTLENEATFGRGNSNRGQSAFPKLRFVTLIETGTKAMFGIKCAGFKESSELELAKHLVNQLSRGMLCLADRYFLGYPLWKMAADTGADLLWRSKMWLVFAVEKRLPDGSYLSTLYESPKDRLRGKPGIPIRVIEYRLKGFTEERIRLITTILDCESAPANELAALYHERWEVETALNELKTHLRGARVVLRSKTPDLVKQEFYGLLLSYFSIRALMHEAAEQADLDPDRLSFLHSVRVIKRAVPSFGIFPPATMV